MEIKDVSIDLIKTGVNDLRGEYDDEDMESLIVSIRRIGLLQPITVREVNGEYEVIAGHRRTYACRKAGIKEIPVIVTSLQKEDTAEIAFSENFFRKDLTPLEVANGIFKLLDEDKMTVEQVAKACGKSSSWIRLQLSILEWPEDCQAVLHSGKLNFSTLINIAQVRDDTYRGYLLRQAVDNGATARTTAAWLQAWQSQIPVEQAVQSDPLPIEAGQAPLVPSAPCLVCGQVKPNQSLCLVMVCPGCVNNIRKVMN